MERVKNILKRDRPAKWIFYGDSITHGARHTFGVRDYSELFTERLRHELGRRMDIVIKTAISGNKTNDLLSGFDWRVAQFNPDVVFLMIGMNDCSKDSNIGLNRFEENLLELVQKIKKLDAIPVLQTTCPILPGQAPDRSPYFDSYMDAIRKTAHDQDVPIIDHTRFWNARADSHFYWMSNAFHPNGYGHRALAEYLFRCLDIYDASSPSCKFYIP